ncbi:MAG: N-6 DNA methylase [Pirellulales bacterium]|nr:N-6 DNA methylase [Pirellulales bacterium]
MPTQSPSAPGSAGRRHVLNQIDSWCKLLAGNLALRNRQLSERDLNFAVERTIERLVFLQLCEARGMQRCGTLRTAAAGPDIYARLREIFEQAENRYLSSLFHFTAKTNRQGPPDELTLCLMIDDKPLRQIITRLQFPEGPHGSSVFPAEILGQVYEQFLGKTIRLRAGRRAVVEDTPEAKKAGGVYYTPPYLVDYLVRRTLGRLLEEQTPKQAERLRILDPACGSGAFLLGAYQHLLDWHRDRYLEEGPDRRARGRSPRLCRAAGGDWRLTIAERKRILLNNIYGVDIDPRAVEVTKLSLLLKLLEGENGETPNAQLRHFPDRILPVPGDNIQCGNALIGPDFHDRQQTEPFEEDDLLRINPFDWEAEFPEVFRSGRPGFDAVIGNPPYLSFSGRQAVPLEPPIRKYYEKHYPFAGWQTSHGLFIVKSLRLANRMVAMIVPDQVGHLDGYGPVRSAITRQSRLVEVRYWGEQVFQRAVTPALTFLADINHRGPARIETSAGRSSLRKVTAGEAWLPVLPQSGLIDKLRAQSRPLDEAFADPGVHTGNCAGRLVLPLAAASPDCAPVLEGKQVDRYLCRPPAKALRLGYRASQGEYFTIRPLEKYRKAAFVVRQTAAYPIAGPRRHADYFRNSLLALYTPADGRDVRFVVAILNSRLMRCVYRVLVKESSQKAFPQVKVGALRMLPIRAIDFARKEERVAHDAIVAMVDRMIDLQARRFDAQTPQDRDVLTDRIESLDGEIDRAVEGLYGLSDEETAQIEHSLRSNEAPLSPEKDK